MATILSLKQRQAQREVAAALGADVAKFVADNPGVRHEHIEKDAGLPVGQISLETHEHTYLRVATAVAVTESMGGGYVTWIYAICRRFGMRAVTVSPSEGGGLAELHRTTSRVMREFGEHCAAVVEATANGHVDAAEIDRLLKEGDDVQMALDAQRGAILALSAKNGRAR